MATQRSKAELLAFFVSGVENITPDMIRDLVESCVPGGAAMHFDDPGSPTTITTPATFVKAANTSTVAGAYRFSHTNNRLTYDGPAPASLMLVAMMSFTCAANNQILDFAVAINGVVQVPSKMKAKISTGTDVQAVALTAHATLAPGDYVEIWVANETSAANITIAHGLVHAMAFLN